MEFTFSAAAYFGYFAGFVTGVVFGILAYKALRPDLLSEAVELLDSSGNLSGVWIFSRGGKLPAFYCGYAPPHPAPEPPPKSL